MLRSKICNTSILTNKSLRAQENVNMIMVVILLLMEKKRLLLHKKDKLKIKFIQIKTLKMLNIKLYQK